MIALLDPHTLKRYTSEDLVLPQLDDLPLIIDTCHDPKALKSILQQISDDANRIERSGMGTVAYL